jgi:hypothetical protein
MSAALRRKDFDSYKTLLWFALPMIIMGPLAVWLLGWMIHGIYITPAQVKDDSRALVQAYEPYRNLSSYPQASQIIAQLTKRNIPAAIANKRAIESYRDAYSNSRDAIATPPPIFVRRSGASLTLSRISYGFLLSIKGENGNTSKVRGLPNKIPNSDGYFEQVGMSVLIALIFFGLLVRAEILFQHARLKEKKLQTLAT